MSIAAATRAESPPVVVRTSSREGGGARSVANPRPNTLANVATKLGQRRPNSKARPFREEHHGGEGDREADQRDVRDERERLHLPRLEDVVLIRGDQDTGVDEGGADGIFLPPAREP